MIQASKNVKQSGSSQLQSTCKYFLHLMNCIQPQYRPYFRVNVSFIRIHYKNHHRYCLISIATGIQRDLFIWGRPAYTSHLLTCFLRVYLFINIFFLISIFCIVFPLSFSFLRWSSNICYLFLMLRLLKFSDLRNGSIASIQEIPFLSWWTLLLVTNEMPLAVPFPWSTPADNLPGGHAVAKWILEGLSVESRYYRPVFLELSLPSDEDL